MKWFPGSIDTAIQISRQNKALLIVHIATKDAKGKEFDELWDQVDSQNLECPVVGIRLMKDEEPAHQFSAIYATPILPATYLIDQEGTPLEVITHLIGLNNETFNETLTKAVRKFSETNGSRKVVPSPPVDEKKEPTVEETKSPSQSSSNTKSDVTTDADDTKQQLSVEEKVEIARKLLEKKREIDNKNKIEMDKQKELERIRNMKEMQKAREDRQEKELIETAKQRAKEKLEASKEKERILAQIKADREEAEFRRKQKSLEPVANSSSNEQQQTKPVPSDRCRIQVRLPNNSLIIEEFPSNDCLNSLVEIIKQKSSITGEFEISQMYPKKVFGPSDLEKSFLENHLTPSASLIVTQKTSTTSRAVSTASGGIINLLTWLLTAPLNFLFVTITSFFNGSSKKEEDKKKKETRGAATIHDAASGDGPRMRGMPRTAEVRRRGNVAGIDNPNDDDPEEEARYNGNSTSFL